ncbi:long polar fimbrial protein LpfA [Salmonella enterica subsp. enterica serovar Muenchen]|nr:long polar fimbrial protein LpfA [Salmonella enterica subsp. enterica serovar Muenchen]
MRNKIILAMAAAGMMCATSAFATTIPTTDAGNGTINFTGSVIDAPCSVSTDSQNINVILGQVSKNQLKSADESSDPKKITISLLNCSFEAPSASNSDSKQSEKAVTDYSKVAVAFTTSGGLDAEALKKGEIANTAPAPATNVVIQLLKSDGVSPVDLSSEPTQDDATQLNTASETNDLIFYARMLATGVATPGAVGASVTYKLKYF